MRPVPSQRVWTLLAQDERIAVTAAIVRVLTEVVENERIDQDSTESQATPRCGLPASIQPQAGSEELRKRHQSAIAPQPPV